MYVALSLTQRLFLQCLAQHSRCLVAEEEFQEQAIPGFLSWEEEHDVRTLWIVTLFAKA